MPQNRLEFIANSLPFLISYIDKNKRYVFVNDAYVHWFGKSKDAFLGKTVGEALGEEAAVTLAPYMDAALSGRRTSFEVEAPYDNGGRRFISATYVPDIAEDGAVLGFSVHVIDISKKMKIESDLLEAIRSRDEFLSVVSHELKTPLTSLLLQTQNFKRWEELGDPKAKSPEKISKIIHQTNKQVDRIVNLVNDMLDIAKIRTGNFTMRREHFDLCELIREVIDRLSIQFNDAGISIRLDVCPTAIGFWDRFRLEQVLTNLFTNAIRYGKGGPVEVGVNQHPKKVVLQVRDYGFGIDKKDHIRIFNRFERAITASEVSGLGLGLFITKQIIEAHKGSIWVESYPGQGSCFFVELPIDVEPHQESIDLTEGSHKV